METGRKRPVSQAFESDDKPAKKQILIRKLPVTQRNGRPKEQKHKDNANTSNTASTSAPMNVESTKVTSSADEKSSTLPSSANQQGTTSTAKGEPGAKAVSVVELKMDDLPLSSTQSQLKNFSWHPILKLCSYLDLFDLAKMSITCKAMMTLMNHDKIWDSRCRLGLLRQRGNEITKYTGWSPKHRTLWGRVTSPEYRPPIKRKPAKKNRRGRRRWEDHREQEPSSLEVADALFRTRSTVWTCIMRERKRNSSGTPGLFGTPRIPQNEYFSKPPTEIRAKTQKEQQDVMKKCSSRLAAEGHKSGFFGSSLVDYRADRAAFDTAGGNRIMEELNKAK